MNVWPSVRFFRVRAMFVFWFAVSTVGLALDAEAAEGRSVIIGAGSVTGVYFPVAGAICQVANNVRSGDEPTCVVVPGGGSKANLEALREGRLDFAIVQSDWQFWAHNGAEFFSDPEPFSSLNAVFALHAEPLIIAVRRDSGISTLADLKDKRVGVGAPATAERGMMEALLGALDWSMSDFAEVHEVASQQQTAALCNNTIDAAIYAVGSPSATLAGLAERCDVSFIPVTGPAVDKLLAEKTFYRNAAVPAGIYSGIDVAVPTFGVGATLVTRADVADAAVAKIVAAVFENFDGFRALHPALTWLDADQMVRRGLSAPLHPAATRYFANREGS